LAALRANNFFFFYSRKDAEPQRNSGPPTSGRLTEKEKYPFFAPSLLCAPTPSAAVDFSSRQGAEPQRNCGPSKKGSPSRNPASFKIKILWVKFN
jgi:hypothetical protein